MAEGGVNGLPKCTILSIDGWTAEIYAHGAHVASWKNPEGKDILFLSSRAEFNPPKAIRGGIPVCWPQFSDMGPIKTQHGFARNSTFELKDLSTDTVTLSLTALEGAHAEFPSAFELIVHVQVGSGWLKQTMQVRNCSSTPLQFTGALHTYLRLYNGIETAQVRGLRGFTYLDSLANRVQVQESDGEVRFPGEVDRIYCGVPNTLEMVDGDRVVTIEKSESFRDVVVWNPYVEKAARMADFGDSEWRDMVCVEVAQAGSGPITVQPGGSWEGWQRLSI